jgi:pilus assembly protein Flp/PilA
MQITKFFKSFARDEEGVTAIEYGLIAALIAVAIIISATLVGDNLALVFDKVATELAKALA